MNGIYANTVTDNDAVADNDADTDGAKVLFADSLDALVFEMKEMMKNSTVGFNLVSISQNVFCCAHVGSCLTRRKGLLIKNTPLGLALALLAKKTCQSKTL